jgi:hypothetical protein
LRSENDRQTGWRIEIDPQAELCTSSVHRICGGKITEEFRMGLFARFTCLRREGTANDLATIVRDLLRARNVVETPDPAAAERLLMIAPAGDGWLMVFDHVENPPEAMADADGLLAELGRASGTLALDIVVADSDELIFLLMEGGSLQAQLAVDGRGAHGPLEPWHHVLRPGQAIEGIRKAFAKPTTFIEEHFPALEPLFGIDLTAFHDVGRLMSGQAVRGDAVVLRLKAIPAVGQVVGPPRLEVDETHRQAMVLNQIVPQIPRGFVTNFPAFSFHSRGGGARGLEVRLSGSALKDGLIEITSAALRRHHPTDRNRNQDIEVMPEMTPAGAVLRFSELDIPDWVQPELNPIVIRTAPRHRSLQDFMVWVYARGVKIGDGELEAEARLLAPASAPVRTSYPVTVLPQMWHPLKGSEQPNMIQDVLALNRPARLNGLAVLRDGPAEAVSALRRTLETWRSLVDPNGVFSVAAAMKPVDERTFFWPADSAQPFQLELGRKRQAKWDGLVADLPSVHGLRVMSEPGIGRHGSSADYKQRHAARIALQYMSAASHPRLPEYAARLGHVSLSLPADHAGQMALVSLLQTLANEQILGQAYVATWDHDDEPKNTLYERAGDVFVHQRTARGWGTRYLRAVADRMWLGPDFAAMLPDRAALERVAIVDSVGDTLAIERRPEATLRDLEQCLEPMLASKVESEAFWDRFAVRR